MLDITPLFDISKKIVDLYRANLNEAGMRPEGRLANFTWNVDFNGSLFQLTFHLPPEWYWVEYGRKPSTKMPPVDKIEEWVNTHLTTKKLVPQGVRRKTEKSSGPQQSESRKIAWAVAKKIQKKGFYGKNGEHHGKHPLEKTFNESSEYVEELCHQISKILSKEVTSDLAVTFKGLKSFK